MQELWFLCSACRVMLIDIYMKFLEDSLNGFQVKEQIWFCDSPREIQSNLDSSNTDGSFTMANSNSFLSPYKVLPIAQENKYLGKYSYFIVKLYVVCTH